MPHPARRNLACPELYFLLPFLAVSLGRIGVDHISDFRVANCEVFLEVGRHSFLVEGLPAAFLFEGELQIFEATLILFCKTLTLLEDLDGSVKLCALGLWWRFVPLSGVALGRRSAASFMLQHLPSLDVDCFCLCGAVEVCWDRGPLPVVIGHPRLSRCHSSLGSHRHVLAHIPLTTGQQSGLDYTLALAFEHTICVALRPSMKGGL